MIFATKGFAKIPSQNLEIKGDKFIYNKLISELTIIDNVNIIDKEKNVNIESEKIILSYKDKRVRYFYSNINLKLYQARNIAIRKARGDSQEYRTFCY